MEASRQAILDYILSTLQDLSRDWDYSREVGPDSRLFTELGFESLDAVVLGTSIQEHYRQPMPFAEFLSEIGRDQRDVTVAELVDFVYLHLNQDHQQRSAS